MQFCPHVDLIDWLSGRYNVEHRAAKVISKIEDPAAPAMRAPMYKSDKELLGESS